MARLAKTEEEATHRWPTSVHWGEGYFRMMRCAVAESHEDAMTLVPPGITNANMQVKVDGVWRWSFSTKLIDETIEVAEAIARGEY